MNDPMAVARLAQAIVAVNMTGSSDPYAVAASTIRETVQVALRALPAWDPASDLAVEDAVRGGVQALIVAELDVAKGTVAILRELTAMAHETGRDPAEISVNALKGVAALRRMLTPVQVARLMRAIEFDYSGAGHTFMALLSSEPVSNNLGLSS